MDVQDVLSATAEGKELPQSVRVPVDFYPLSILLSRGIISVVEVEIVERRDIGFSYFRLGSRVRSIFEIFRIKLNHENRHTCSSTICFGIILPIEMKLLQSDWQSCLKMSLILNMRLKSYSTTYWMTKQIIRLSQKARILIKSFC